jgi:hypothetical protein
MFKQEGIVPPEFRPIPWFRKGISGSESEEWFSSRTFLREFTQKG